ncbi:MAG: phosphopyruvate hydratase [Halobacteriales archaeon]
MTVQAVTAWEVLDSRGDPTVRVRVAADGGTGTFTVPAGASTGEHEAVERRDSGDRYGGKGVRLAVQAVREELGPAIVGRDVTAQRRHDERLVEVDGTPDLSRLGANAVLGVSGAIARAASAVRGEPLYQYLAASDPGPAPLPMVNMLSGGSHAPGGFPVQDILAVPVGADSFEAALETSWSVREALRQRILAAGDRPLVADEGGFSPPLQDVEAAFELVVASIRDAGFDPGSEVALAVDVAASEFHADGAYRLGGDCRLDRDAMVDRVSEWVETYPIVSIEDPLAEDDWSGWEALAQRLGERVQLLADDLVVTDRGRLDRAIEQEAANAAIIKPNQAGTLTRTLDVIDAVRSAGWAGVVSARSGETADTTIADLAVARHVGQIKIGSLARSERLAKYNRLLEMVYRDDLDYVGTLPFSDPP